jgi:hypothetical protein
MNDDEFDAFAQEANDELDSKQTSLEKKFQLGKWAAFFYDTPSGLLQFKDKSEKVRVEAQTSPIGSFSSKSDTWQWAWANKSTPPDVRKQAEELKKLFKLTGMDVFKMPTVEVDESMAWELVAMCVKHLQSLGCYAMSAGSDGNLQVFVAIREIRKATD